MARRFPRALKGSLRVCSRLSICARIGSIAAVRRCQMLSKRRAGYQRALNAPATTTRVRTRKEALMRLARSLRIWRQYRRTANELNRLSQREFADLRIARADISPIARQPTR